VPLPVVLKSETTKKVVYTVPQTAQTITITVEKATGALRYSFSVVQQADHELFLPWAAG
jgi:hypothetical protein